MGTARRRTQRTTSRTTATRSRLLAPETPAAEADLAVNWQTEYKYVFNDIRQLLIISAALFVMLFVVGFFF